MHDITSQTDDTEDYRVPDEILIARMTNANFHYRFVVVTFLSSLRHTVANSRTMLHSRCHRQNDVACEPIEHLNRVINQNTIHRIHSITEQC